jgi:aerobic carbon-monoxide dehydrogenase large subunit
MALERKERFVGQPLPRLEDERLIRGKGQYSDDVPVPDALRAVMVRAPYASARLTRLDVSAAQAAPGVVTVFTAADFLADGGRNLQHGPAPNDNVDPKKKAFQRDKGHWVFDVAQQVFVQDTVRHIGEIVAVVLAETVMEAQDAAELVAAEYDVLTPVLDLRTASDDGRPQLWAEAPNNVCLDATLGDPAAVEVAFANAHLIVEGNFINQRVSAAQMEPRSAATIFDPATDVSTLYYGTQGPLRHRTEILSALGLALEKVVVISKDVGGAFGARSHTNPEALIVVWASRRLKRNVRWTGGRMEAFLADFTGRDMYVEAAIALDKDGRVLALREKTTCNIGAYTVSYSSPQNFACIATGVYDIGAVSVRLYGVMTNSVPTTSYRGAGRPEAHLAMERLLDIAATRLDIDRIEIRKRNFIAQDAFPKRTAIGLLYDSGDFLGNMELTMKNADWDGFPARREESESCGMLRGIGLANYIESPVGNPRERVELTVRPEGIVDLVIGTMSSGQGHETVFAQVAADCFEVELDQINIITGDTRVVKVGGGTQSNRSMRFGGRLIGESSDDIIAQGRALLADRWNCSPDDIAYGDGAFSGPANARETLFELAATAELKAAAEYNGRIPAFPTGCAICELEVDPTSGEVKLLKYTQVDDVGQAINPLIVHGQTHGGIAQGVGQALFEDLTPDPDTGEPAGTSFMTYGMPRTYHLPPMNIDLTEDPTPGNRFRVKGGGEGGVTPAPAAVISAICDALQRFGIEYLDTPATPERVWTAIQNARLPALA